MDISPVALFKSLLPRVPSLVQSAASHSLGFSPTSSKWDLRTDLTVAVIRSFVTGKPTTISKQQRPTLRDPGIKGPMWISKVTIPKPEEDDIQKSLVDVINVLTEAREKYTVPDLVPVEAEWTGFRAGVDAHRSRPDLSEQQHYDRLMKEVTSPVTILYFHGGAYFLMDPASHRPTTSKLAKLTGGRVLSVRYRLAPQHAFPAALLDAFLVYLSLLFPSPDSLYKPVPAHNIVFAGDSAGGNLSMVLLQLILQLHRSSPAKHPTIRFNGKDVEVPLPAGVAGCSPWMDFNRCLPSNVSNSKYDYLPPPNADLIKHFPKCEIWPSDPPRGDLFCETSMLCHPLVSPLAAKEWVGSCPLFLGYGSECLVDEGKIVARRAVEQGVKVVWAEFEAMPHCFAQIFEHLEGSKKFFKDWAQFALDVVDGKPIETSGTFIEAKTLIEKPIDISQFLTELSDKDVERMMADSKEKRWTGEEGEAKALPKL